MSSLLSGCSAAAVINEGFVVASKGRNLRIASRSLLSATTVVNVLIGQVLYESLIFNIFSNKSYVFFIAQTLSILSIYQLLCFKEKRLCSASKLKLF